MLTKAKLTKSLYINVRYMIAKDRPQVLKIERESFEFPWTAEEYQRAFKNSHVIGKVAEYSAGPNSATHPPIVVGAIVYELHKSRLHLLNIAVDPEFRRRGVASQLMAKLAGGLSRRRSRIMLEVRETNLDAQLFFRSLGFRAISVLRGFYEDSSEDAYLMQFSAAQLGRSLL